MTKAVGWTILFAVGVYGLTVCSSAILLFRELQLADAAPTPRKVLLWQAITYGLWLPVAAVVWKLFRQRERIGRSIGRYLAIGLVAIPLHAALTGALDARWTEPGTADLFGLMIQRLQLDILVYASFGLLGLAATYQRLAASEAAAAKELRDVLEAAGSASRERSHNAPDARLMVAAGTKRMMVPLEEVEWLGSAGNYVVVNWSGKEGLIRQTLQAAERSLPGELFARAHRSTIVNLAKVERAVPLSDGSWRLTMFSGAEIVVSRTHRDAILDRLRRHAPPS